MLTRHRRRHALLVAGLRVPLGDASVPEAEVVPLHAVRCRSIRQSDGHADLLDGGGVVVLGAVAEDVGHGRRAGAPDEHVEVFAVLALGLAVGRLLGLGRRRHGRVGRRVLPVLAAGLVGRRRVLLVVGRPRRGAGAHPERVPGGEVGAAPDHGVEVSVVEAGAPRRRVARRLQRVDLGVGEVARPRRGAGEPHGAPRVDVGARRVGAAHGDVYLAVLLHLGLRLDHVPPPVERHDVGVHDDGRDGARGVRELLGDEDPGAAVLEHEEHQRVPDDALEHHDLHHEATGELPVHPLQQRDPHDERVGQRGEGEEGDGPLEGAAAGEVAPQGEEREDDELLQGVGGDEAEVHGVGVVGGDEVEGEERDGEERHEAVDPGALVGREDAPPLHRPVRQDHRHVQRHHRRHHVVEVRPRYHLA
ncbi:Os06g0232350, partial [Oryza sativa Japonica Group]